MADKIVRALVTGDRPTYINGVLHMQGEEAVADLDALGVDKLGDKTPGLVPVKKSDEPAVVEVPVAAVAPHAPDAVHPQGIPTGSVQSGTGRIVQVDPRAGSDDETATVEPVGADKPGVEGEQTPQKPEKPKK